jgi:hypothetical protein
MPIPESASEMPPAIPRVAPDTVLMSLVLSALSTAGVLECGLCSFLMAGPAGRWLRGCVKTTSSLFSAAVAVSVPCAPRVRFLQMGNSGHESANAKRQRNANVG